MKNLSFVSLLIIVLATGCNNEPEVFNYSVAGGHKFLSPSNDSVFPYYPLKSKMPQRDSFNNAFYTAALLDAFDEPNISLHPADVPVFRFIFQCLPSPAYIVTISKNEIVIKEGQQAHYLNGKDSLLGAKDDLLLDIFKKRFPVKQGDTTINESERRNLDSTIAMYPELLRTGYYDTLIRRAYSPLTFPFKYREVKKAISEKEFNDLFSLINQYGYWKLPYNVRCQSQPAQGCFFSLEANSTAQYNFVKSGTCDGPPKAFDTICHAITKAAGLTGKIKVKEGFSN